MNRTDPVAVRLVAAIQQGELDALRTLLADHPGLAAARLEDANGATSTPLHAATDWPGHYPEGAATVWMLLVAGADPDAAVTGSYHRETPLHWAASSDDVEVAAALLDGGANIEAPGASIAGGTPLDDAIGYGQWQVARFLVARGARVDRLWHAAALGMLDRLRELWELAPPSREELDHAFWQACHGGQIRTARYLHTRGADPHAHPDHNDTAPLDIAGTPDGRRELLVRWLREINAAPPAPPAPG